MSLPIPKEMDHPKVLNDYVNKKLILKVKEKKQLFQGDQIIKKAQHAAKQMIVEAKKKEQKMLSSAKAKYQDGFKSGSEKGRQGALKEGLNWLMDINEIKTSILNHVKDHVLDTLESVLIHTFQNAAPGWIKQQLEKILTSLEEKEEVEVHVSEMHAANITETITSGEHKGINIKVISNPEDGDSCFVRTHYFEAEFSLAGLKEALMAAFHAAFEETQE